MSGIFDEMESVELQRVLWLHHPATRMRALVAIDDVTLGPAAGGIRTQTYADEATALADAARLARSMTLKCSLAGLDAGGGKVVVMEVPGLNRDLGFRWLGQELARLDHFWTGGDVGTTRRDLQRVAECSPRVATDLDDLAVAVARGVVSCMHALAGHRGVALGDLRVAIQGCGQTGSALATELDALGCGLVLCDTDISRARALARTVQATVVPPHAIWRQQVDVVSPCAVGGVLNEHALDELKAWGVCGAANNVLDTPQLAQGLLEREIRHVPGIVTSAGAVLAGLGPKLMGWTDVNARIDALGEMATEILEAAEAEGRPELHVAEDRAWERIELG
jgi:leucine dehydrogenase